MSDMNRDILIKLLTLIEMVSYGEKMTSEERKEYHKLVYELRTTHLATPTPEPEDSTGLSRPIPGWMYMPS